MQDSTLITTSSGNVFGREASDWKWWHPSVPSKLKQLHASGYQLAILSNQGGINLNTKGPKPVDPKRLNVFKTKVGYVLNQLDLPLSLYAATAQNLYRKPRTGMWREVLEDYDLEDAEGVKLKECVFVGDAAGRLARGKVKADHSSSDRNFADNVGITFYTPEEYFLDEQPVEWKRTFDPLTYVDKAVDVVAGEKGEETTTKAQPVFDKRHELDIVLLVGSPGSGKSTFYWTFLEPLGYERANQDLLKTRERCIKHARACLESGKSVAVDNTNADDKTRADWVSLARECKVPIRCVWLQAPPEICKHNDTVRSLGGSEGLNPEKRTMLPAMAFSGYTSRFKQPKVAVGFTDVVEVPFEFRGDEEEKRVWGKYWT